MSDQAPPKPGQTLVLVCVIVGMMFCYKLAEQTVIPHHFPPTPGRFNAATAASSGLAGAVGGGVGGLVGSVLARLFYRRPPGAVR